MSDSPSASLDSVIFLQLQEEERQRLAHTLMSGPGQVLANTLMEIEYALPLLEKNPPVAKAGLAALQTELRQGLAQLKELVAELQPPLLEEMGLGASIGQYLDKFTARTGIRADCRGCEGFQTRYPRTIELALFRVLQEALANVATHAHATTIRIELQRQQDHVRMTVQDNGRGFVPQPPKTKKRALGLIVLRDRVELLGGQLQLFSETGRGVRLVVTIPYHGHVEEPTAQGRQEPHERRNHKQTTRTRKSNTGQEKSQAPAPEAQTKTPRSKTRKNAPAAATAKPAGDPGKISVLIVDDHPVFRGGLRGLLELEDSIQVVGEAQDGQQALDMGRALRPQVILMDINLPFVNGMQATRELTGERADLAVIVLTAYHDDEQMLQAIRSGASGYFPKEVAPSELLEAIRTVSRGKYAITEDVLAKPQVASWLINEFETMQESAEAEAEETFRSLSVREMEILKLITRGLSNKEIAKSLGISRQTVKNHMTSILRKLAVNDRTQAAVYALRRGWIRLQDTE